MPKESKDYWNAPEQVPRIMKETFAVIFGLYLTQ